MKEYRVLRTKQMLKNVSFFCFFSKCAYIAISLHPYFVTERYKPDRIKFK